MPYTFELKLVITGNSLQEIDTALTEAATERLRSRMVNPAGLPTNVPLNKMVPPAGLNFVPPSTKEEPRPDNSGINHVPNVGVNATVERHGTPTGQAPAEEKRKPGRPKKSDAEAKAETIAANVTPVGEGNASAEVAAPSPAPQAATQIATPEAAIEALKLVNKKHNVDKARWCLGEFKVAKCGELTDANRHLFVQLCESICV